MRQRNVKNKEDIINNSKYFLKNPEEYKGKWHEVFKNKNAIKIEIGTGKGKFIIENARKYKNINFVGIEKNDSILAIALKHIPDDIENLKMIRLDAKNIDDIFYNEVSTIYLNFSDPWPKKRHEKRRLTSPIFLEKYENISKDKVEIQMKTDNKNLFSYSLITFNNLNYHFDKLTFDLGKIDDMENIKTEYEEKFEKLNIPINLIIVTKNKK